MRSRAYPPVLALVAVVLASPANAIEKPCPYGASQGQVLFGFTMNSWDEYWELYRASHLGQIVFETIVDEVIPSVLKIADVTGEIENLPKTLHDFATSIDWSLLRRSEVCGILHSRGRDFPAATLKLTPPPLGVERLHKTLRDLLGFFASHSQGLLVSRTEGEEACLALAPPSSASPSSSVSAATGSEVLRVLRSGDSVWLTTDPAYSPSIPKRSPKPTTEVLWSRLPDSTVSTVLLDLEEIGDALRGCLDQMIGRSNSTSSTQPRSSLVLDETMEALFGKDPETLEKLKKVESDFNLLMPSEVSKALIKPAERLLKIIGDQGTFLSGSAPSAGGVMGTTFWSTRYQSDHGDLLEAPPVSERMVGLLQPDVVEVSIQGLPNLKELYSTVMDLFKELPGGDTLLKEWQSLQESFGYSVEAELLPAIGKEMGWISRESKKGGLIGLQVLNNDVFFVLDIGDLGAARQTRTKMEQTLSSYGFPATATSVADVTFSVLNTGIMGKALWGLLPDPPLLVFTTSDSEAAIASFVISLRNPPPQGLSRHPRWEELKAIWTEKPVAVNLANVGTTWKQALGQLKSTQMMMALMGEAGSLGLPFVRLGIRALQNMESAEWFFSVTTAEPGLRISRTLLLYSASPAEALGP